mmetsp:Transcript_31953/g.23092  ORF Transcript_31953/g.23092 Transcript_31953/m.23092 type:complete len:139 (+) Transcript_31953:65-481(+)
MCGCCGSCGVPAKNWPKLTYVFSSFIFMIFAIIVSAVFQPAADEFDWFYCHEEAGGGSVCFGASAVVRMAFALFLYHLIILIAISPRAGCSSVIHDGFWTLKFILILAVYIAVFWIPHSFFLIWAHVCRVGSVLFLIV